MPDPLASPGDLAAYLGHDVDAATATVVLDGASALVRGYCGWIIAPAATDVAMVVDGSGARVQALPTRHLTAVTAVTDNDVALDVGALQWSEAGYLFAARPFTRRLRGVVATVSHGYAEVPPEVAMVVLSIAARTAENPTGMTQYTIGGVNVSYGSSSGTGPMLQPLERAVLDRHRIFGAA